MTENRKLIKTLVPTVDRLTPYTRAVVLRGLSSPFRNVRLWACKKVALDQTTRAVPSLISLLDSKDTEISLQAAVALNEISHISVRNPISSIAEDKDRFYGDIKVEKVKSPLAKTIDLWEQVESRQSSGFSYYLKDSGPVKFSLFVICFFVLVWLGSFFYESLSVPDVESMQDFAFVSKRVVLDHKNSKALDHNNSNVVFEDTSVEPASGLVQPPHLSNSQLSPLQLSKSQLGESQLGESRLGKSQVSRVQAAVEVLTETEELWLALAKRYLAAGRPHECVKYCNLIIRENKKSIGARKLKRLAYDRYGVLD